MGAATALYSATCHVLGQYGNGNLYPVNLSAVVGLSGWLPCSRFTTIHILAYPCSEFCCVNRHDTLTTVRHMINYNNSHVGQAIY